MKLFFILLSLILSGCFYSQRIDAPHINQHNQLHDVLWFEIIDQATSSKSLLSVQPLNNHQWRWVQVDLLGAPIARQIMGDTWNNDGFLPPNAEASQFFYYMISIIANLKKENISCYYDDIDTEKKDNVTLYYQQKKLRWTLQSIDSNVWKITTAEHVTWQIRLIDND